MYTLVVDVIRAILCLMVSSVLTSHSVWPVVKFVTIVLFFFLLRVCKCVSVCVCLGMISGLLLFVETTCPVFSLLHLWAWGNLKL